MKKLVLGNGLTLITEKKNTDSVALQFCVKVGSNHEPYNLNGISHFIEHMLFEGTKHRKHSKDITNEIESLGGEINAYTSNDRTCYYIKVLKRHFDEALDILNDMMQFPLFEYRKVEKERKVIVREIDMVHDEPRYYQWVLFYNHLFQKHPAKYPVYGRREVIEKVSRQDMINYYRTHYLADNSMLSVVGNVENVRKKVEKAFRHLPQGKIPAYPRVHEPFQIRPKVIIERKNTQSSYMVLGYKTPSRFHKDSYALDVVKSILGRGQSGIIVDEVRNKRGLAYDIGVSHETTADYGIFAVHLNVNKRKIPLAKKLILKEFKNLGKVSSQELKDAKGYIEGQFLLDQEDTHEHADSLCYWELIKDAKLAEKYVEKINRVGKKDVARAASKYLNENYTLTIIQQK